MSILDNMAKLQNIINLLNFVNINTDYRGIIDKTIVKYSNSNITSIGNRAFYFCTKLTSIDLPNITNIGDNAFEYCEKLSNIIIRTNAVCAIPSSSSSTPFKNTPIESGAGYIYVPSSLVDAYKTNSNWSIYVNQIRALEDYTVDGTITGALDPNKI